jgi:predicted secreted Zn-dependent protease
MTPMTAPKDIAPSAVRRSWSRFWNGLRTLDEALHHDPAEALHRKVQRLEARLSELESAETSTGGTA